MNNDWLPIETAPKNRRILLGYEKPVFTGIYCIIGEWYEDFYVNKPAPYFKHDLEYLKGKRNTQKQQPCCWQELPVKPEV